jgi:nickel-dependent lactate racemase
MKELNMSFTLAMRTGAWYGDHMLELAIPDNWDTTVLWPQTPPPMTENQIVEILQKPIGQPSIQRLCNGKSLPLIIIDDLNRPTPAEPIIRILLEYFEDARIPLRDVTFLMATGSHGTPAADAMRKKVGTKAAESCRLLVHDCFHGNVKIGNTSFCTPVCVNRAVLESDFVIGIGGIYPNYTAGFGGGTKLALGVLGLQSIFDLHYRHESAGWGSAKVDSSLRRDLNEIASMIGLHTVISLQINVDREIIRVDCGDPQKYYPEALDFYRRTFGTLALKDADVIVSNTYPSDLSLTFARMKGFWPLRNCKSSASRIAIASCEEGVGLHNIAPFLNAPRFHEERYLFRLIRAFGLVELSKKGLKRICRKMLSASKANTNYNQEAPKHPVWLYRPGKHSVGLPSRIPGMMQTSQWPEVLQVIHKEQGPNKHLKVVIYPCAFLQFIDQS